MREVLAVSFALILFGCSMWGDPATDDEKKAATNAFLICLDRAAYELDDHASDASTIAMAVAGRCTGEFHASVETFSRGMNPSEKLYFLKDMQQSPQLMSNATAAVLYERANPNSN